MRRSVTCGGSSTDCAPPPLDELGLIAALDEELRRLQQATGVPCTITAPGRLPAVPAAVEVAALRIALEGATNVVRHASAAACAVTVEVGNRHVVVRVDDDGTGLRAGTTPGVGLVSMRERAEEVGGTVEVAARPEGGTRVSAVLPLPRTSGGGS